MSYLLDTHTFLWYIDGNPKLSHKAKAIIRSISIKKFVSIASLWEIAIKTSKQKLTLTLPFEILPEFALLNEFDILNIEFKHISKIQSLPHYHGDPFDRMIIAQAISEDLAIVSVDQHFQEYPVPIVW